jgi:hypothetical protein
MRQQTIPRVIWGHPSENIGVLGNIATPMAPYWGYCNTTQSRKTTCALIMRGWERFALLREPDAPFILQGNGLRSPAPHGIEK